MYFLNIFLAFHVYEISADDTITEFKDYSTK